MTSLGWSTEWPVAETKRCFCSGKKADLGSPSQNPYNLEHIFSQIMSVEKVCATLLQEWDTKKAVSINTHTNTHTCSRIFFPLFPIHFFPTFSVFLCFSIFYFNKALKRASFSFRSTFYYGHFVQTPFELILLISDSVSRVVDYKIRVLFIRLFQWQTLNQSRIELRLHTKALITKLSYP